MIPKGKKEGRRRQYWRVKEGNRKFTGIHLSKQKGKKIGISRGEKSEPSVKGDQEGHLPTQKIFPVPKRTSFVQRTSEGSRMKEKIANAFSPDSQRKKKGVERA